MAPRSTRRTRLADITAVGLLAAALASGSTYAVMTSTQQEGPTVVEASGQVSSTQAEPASFTSSQEWGAVAARVGPSVVSIEVATAQGGGAGSGVVWDTQGHIVTNAHVVQGAQEVRVTLDDGRSYAAQVTGSDPATDLAVLSLDDGPSDLTPIEHGAVDDLAVGDPLMAVGNPLGLSGTVTTGIISALDRPVSTRSSEQGSQGSPPAAVVTNAIQTSAAINPGNSGGALVDASGRLIGINSAIASLSSGPSGQGGSIGIGFAIPMSSVDNIVGQLIESGSAEHAFLGVGLADDEATVDGATLTGAAVTQVEEDSPAAAAGMQEGDLIVDIDGERVGSAEALVGQVRERTIGAQVTVDVIRDGQRQELTAALDTRPDEG